MLMRSEERRSMGLVREGDGGKRGEFKCRVI